MEKLTNLEVLATIQCEQTHLSEDVKNLRNLKILDLSYTNLGTLPPEIGQLNNLTHLYLDRCGLTELPLELSELSKLEYFSIEDNSLKSPPPEIVEQGKDAVFAYLRDLKEAEEPNWKSKMLVVGEPSVGKTSLINVLRGKKFNFHEKQTHGILIGDLTLCHPEREGAKMNLSCWDFGGQEIYRATHQFFLSEESLFILVWRPRRGDVESRIVHWLQSIKTRAPNSPIVVVANQFEDDSPPDLDTHQLITDFPEIIGFYQVNAATKSGIPELTQAIQSAAEQLPMMGKLWPKKWHDVAEEVRDIKDEHLPAVKFSRFLQEHGISEEDSRAALIKSLHLLGDILHFSDDPELKGQIFLKPQWVSDRIVQAIESEEVVENDGVLKRESRDELWSEVDDHIRDCLTRLMERFDLSYRTPDPEEISLVVDAIPKERPNGYDKKYKEILSLSNSRTIQLKYRFPSLPAGVPTWFIARAHKFTTHIHWRTGAVFTEDPRSYTHMALVVASEADKSVEIQVTGPHPAYFMGVLKRQFEDTLTRYRGLSREIWIPCPGHNGQPCNHEFDFDLLHKQLTRRNPINKVPCNVALANEEIEDPEIDVRNLLYGLHPATLDTINENIEKLGKKIDRDNKSVIGEFRSLSKQTTQTQLLIWKRIQNELDASFPAIFTVRKGKRTGGKKSVHGTSLDAAFAV